MTLRFRRVVDRLPSALPIDTKALESDDIHKVLGVTIQSNLKWDLHINEVVAKASKRLHILRVLKRGGVPPADLLKVYFALIRSVLEYCCPVWHNALPSNYQIASSECRNGRCASSFLRCTTKRPKLLPGVYHFTQEEWSCVANYSQR